MNGHILDGLPIAVDCFLQKNLGYVKCNFLTHMHSDHTVGLSSSWRRTIYCTYTTSKLLVHKFNISSDFIRVLEENETHLVKCGDLYVSVSVISANHCPGSCMFLFETDDVRILYTGDFRMDASMNKYLNKFVGGRPVDILYLDNTYCEPACTHPHRNDAVGMIINLCKDHPNDRIMFGMSWVGHEDLLVNIATDLNEHVYVDENTMNLLKIVEVADVFKQGNSGHLNGVANKHLNCKWIKSCNEIHPTIGIKPSAMYGDNIRVVPNSNGCLYTAPYSNHSNFQELCDFVKLVSPIAIKPIVPGRHVRAGMESFFRADMQQFNHFLSYQKSERCTPENRFRETNKESASLPQQINRETTNVKHRTAKRRKVDVQCKKPHTPRGVVFDDYQTSIDESKDTLSSCCTNPSHDALQCLNSPENTQNELFCANKSVTSLSRTIKQEIEDELLSDLYSLPYFIS